MQIRDDSAVTPVIGTIMIMGIMVVGIAGMLLWGAPVIQAIQDQGALAAMEGEFSTLRTSTDELRVRDASRVPVLSVEAGDIGFVTGTRLAFAVVTDTAPAGCVANLESGWNRGTTEPLVLTGVGCGGMSSATTTAHQFGTGANKTVVKDPSSTATRLEFSVPGQDLREGSWRLQFDVSGSGVDIYVFLVETNRLEWTLQTDSSDLALALEGGALFERSGERVGLLASPTIFEDLFSSGDYVLKWPSYVGPQLTYGAPINLQAQLTLGVNTWALATEAQSIRYSFAGEYAEAWCNTMLLRNNTITAGTYEVTSGFECATGNSEGIRSLTYSSGSDFTIELMTPRVHASLNI